MLIITMDTMAVTVNKVRTTRSHSSLYREAPRPGAFSVLMTALIAGSLFPCTASALDWRLSPSISAAATATDNANQSANDPQNALILSVTPGFSLSSYGSRRVRAALDYGLTGVVRLGDEDQSNDLNHNLGAHANAELIEDFLFFDANASISQQLISLLGSPSDATTNSSNRATVGSYSLSPYVRKRLGNFANAQARITHSGAIFENDAAASSQANAFSASLDSGSRFNDFSWGLSYSLRQAENSSTDTTSADTTTFETTSATLGYALTRKFRVFGTVGRDSNNFTNASASNGNFYTAGFAWSPTRRTSLQASAGKRFLGNTYALSLLHRRRHTTWDVRYSEAVSDISQQISSASNRTYFECGAGSDRFSTIETPTCLIPVTAAQVAVRAFILRVPVSSLIIGGSPDGGIANGVFIIKSLTGGVNWSKGKLGAGVSVFDTRRTFVLLNNSEDHTRGVSSNVNYRLTPHTSANGSLAFTNTQVPTGLSGVAINRDDNLYTLSLGLSHRFDPKLNGALTFRRQQRESNDPLSSYDENSITASISKRF